jgi:hypothetical protein
MPAFRPPEHTRHRQMGMMTGLGAMQMMMDNCMAMKKD